MRERRQYVRIPEEAEITYQVIKKPEMFDFFTRDMSLGGIRFLSNEFIAHDSLLEIRLTLSRLSFSFAALVKVVWVSRQGHNDRYEIGAEFVNLPKEITDRLVYYINSVLGL